ncbi:MAG: DUF1294 domain-containing protein [Coprobacillus sp.]|jgi:uncharacterized membrane protein YsdA (DUF1294 family)|nr:DUF1294 domain-containing protein [Coprobacillus sp.]
MKSVIFFIFNILTFSLYGIDKRKAIKGQWRISERMLLAFALLGGSIGAILAMMIFHHKTKHWKFILLIPLFLMIHIFLFFMFL